MQRKTKRVLVLLLFVIAALAFVMSGASPADCGTSYPGGTSGGSYGGDGEIADSGKIEDSGGGEYYCRHEKAAWETTQEATCTENGREEYWCYDCGRMIDYRTIKPLGHNYSEWQIVTPATDSEDGLKVRHCDRCNDEETQIIPKTTHTHSFTETVVEPTCTERGYTLHQCTCGEHYEDSFKSALDHSFTNYITDNNATCTQDGTKTAKCDRCNETNTITDVGSKTGHIFDKQVATEKYLNSAATCTAKATYFYSCKCGEKGTATFEHGNALGHDYSEWRVVSPATEETTGLMERTCSRCNDKETQIIPKTTHTHRFTETVVEPTCTERGYTLHQCTCGEHYEDSFKSALDHSFTNYITDNNATCTQDGTKTAKCDRCNETNTITDVGSKTGHTFDKQVATEKYLNSAATCTAKATYFYSCKCGEKGTATFEYGNTLEHDYVNGVCSRCGEKDPNITIGLKYTLNSNKMSYSCTGIGTATDTDIIIASVYNGLPVTAIGNYAFKYCLNLTSVIIPNNVTSIGTQAFYSCRNLSNITIPDSLISIGAESFRDCIKITSITIPSSVNSIGDYAFGECYKLVEIINKSVLTISKESTDNGYLGYSALNIKNYGSSDIVNQDEYLFYTFNGINYLLGYTGSKKILTLPESFKGNNYQIYKYAFDSYYGLISLIIPDRVTSIGIHAFDDCFGLTGVTIGNGITSIGEYAFYGCYKLVEVINNSSLNITKSNNYKDIGYYALNIKKGGNSDIVNKDGFLFYTYNNVNYLLGYTGIETKLTLPQNYNGQNYEIYKYAFDDCAGFTSVSIPNSVISIGRCAFRFCSGLTSVKIPDSVTSIDNHAFYGCSGLTSVVIPDSITSIGSAAFERCHGLEKVFFTGDIVSWLTINGLKNLMYYGLMNRKLYFNNKLVTNLVIPDSITTINEYAFYNCKELTSVVISKNISSIGNGAFYGCSQLENIYITDTASWCSINGLSNLMSYGSNNKKLYIHDEVATNLVIPDSITTINEYAFYNCKELTSVVISENISSIGSWAFYGCSRVTSIIIPDSVTEIGRSAFEDCSGLTSVTIPDSVTEIGRSTFEDCSGLTSVIIGNSVTSIGEYAFQNCNKLTSISIGCNVNSIGRNAFSDCKKIIEIINNSKLDIKKGSWDYGNIGCYALNIKKGGSNNVNILDGYLFYTFEDVNYLFGYIGTETELTLPQSYNGQNYEIYKYAFSGCSGLTSITIPDSIKTINNSTFSGCTGLTRIVIPNSITTIDSGAFYGCSRLNSVTLGNNVTSIGTNAFNSCGKLVEVINNSSLNIQKGFYGGNAYIYGYIGFYALNIKKGGNSDIVNKDGFLFYTHEGKNYLLGYIGTETELTLPQSYNGQNYEIYKYAFYKCSGLTSVTIPDSVTSIGSSAFSGCSGLTSITIPDSVTSIGDSAFLSCERLITVSIGKGITSIGNSAFNYCDKLVEIINNSSLNIKCQSSDYGGIGENALCIKNGGYSDIVNKNEYLFYTYGGINYLLGYIGTETELTLPDSYNGQNYEIYKYAFYYCSGLTSVTIGNSVTSIGWWSFNVCLGLTSITISNNVTYIDSRALAHCSRLEIIEYNGTIAQWNAINKESNWNEEIPTTCKIKCTDGTISI